MTKLYMKQAFMTLHKRIEVEDENGNVVYQVSSDFFTLHDKTHVEDANGNSIAELQRKILSFNHKYFVEMNDGTQFQIHDELMHVVKDYIDIPELGWTVRGNLLEHDYEIVDHNEKILAETHRKWISLRESYELTVYDESRLDIIVTAFIVLEHILVNRDDSRTAMDTASEINRN